MNLSWSEHTAILSQPSGHFLLYQICLRKGVLVSRESLQTLLDWQAGKNIAADLSIAAEDVSDFSQRSYLHANSSGVVKPEKTELASLPFEQLLSLLKGHAILSEGTDYLERLAKAKGPMDRKRIGNFHQQMGRFLNFDLRESSEHWWIYQKYRQDLRGMQPNLYAIQAEFIEKEFDRDLRGESWLDLGCGIGYFSRYFADKGAQVLAIDPSEEYVALAQTHNAHPNVTYQKMGFEQPSDFDALKERRFDRIFLCDVLLFFFEPYKPMSLDATQFLKGVSELLAKGGRIHLVDPHGAFFLQPRMGSASPFLVPVEYRNRRFRVVPSLDEMSRAIEAAGLRMERIREVYPSSPHELDAQTKNFAAEFPSWWYFELSKKES